MGAGPWTIWYAAALSPLQHDGLPEFHNNQVTTVGGPGAALEAEALGPYSTGMVSCFACRVHFATAMRLQRENTKEHMVKALNTAQ